MKSKPIPANEPTPNQDGRVRVVMTDFDGEGIDIGGGRCLASGDVAWLNADHARALVRAKRVRYVEQRENGSLDTWNSRSMPDADGMVHVALVPSAIAGLTLDDGSTLDPGVTRRVPALTGRRAVSTGRAVFVVPPSAVRR